MTSECPTRGPPSRSRGGVSVEGESDDSDSELLLETLSSGLESMLDTSDTTSDDDDDDDEELCESADNPPVFLTSRGAVRFNSGGALVVT